MTFGFDHVDAKVYGDVGPQRPRPRDLGPGRAGDLGPN